MAGTRVTRVRRGIGGTIVAGPAAARAVCAGWALSPATTAGHDPGWPGRAEDRRGRTLGGMSAAGGGGPGALVVARGGPAPDLTAAPVLRYGGTGPVPVVHIATWDTEGPGVHRLAGRLGAGQTFVVVTPPVVAVPPAGSPPDGPRTVESWVERARSALGPLGLRGPVVLSGWSFGGVVATHLAQDLADGPGALGPATVVLIDSWHPAPRARRVPPAPLPARARAHARIVRSLSAPEALVHLRGGLRRMARRRRRHVEPPVPASLTPLQRCIQTAWVKYERREINVPGVLLWCDDSRDLTGTEQLRWAGTWTGPLRTGRAGATHDSVYDEPAVGVVAAAIAAAVADASGLP